jgi:hypothetical protein
MGLQQIAAALTERKIERLVISLFVRFAEAAMRPLLVPFMGREKNFGSLGKLKSQRSNVALRCDRCAPDVSV